MFLTCPHEITSRTQSTSWRQYLTSSLWPYMLCCCPALLLCLLLCFCPPPPAALLPAFLAFWCYCSAALLLVALLLCRPLRLCLVVVFNAITLVLRKLRRSRRCRTVERTCAAHPRPRRVSMTPDSYIRPCSRGSSPENLMSESPFAPCFFLRPCSRKDNFRCKTGCRECHHQCY